MIKNLIRSLLITIFVSTFSFAEIVKEIKVEGNKRISKATINVIGEKQIVIEFKCESSILKGTKNFSKFGICLEKCI